MKDLDAVVLAVGHKFYRDISVENFADKLIHRGCFIDVKSIIDTEEAKKKGLNYWRL